MVRSGIIRSMRTLTFWRRGRRTPSVTFRSLAIIGFIAACMEIRLKKAKME
jgi:hypothetical protein